jgi:hypothetical protein
MIRVKIYLIRLLEVKQTVFIDILKTDSLAFYNYSIRYDGKLPSCCTVKIGLNKKGLFQIMKKPFLDLWILNTVSNINREFYHLAGLQIFFTA